MYAFFHPDPEPLLPDPDSVALKVMNERTLNTGKSNQPFSTLRTSCSKLMLLIIDKKKRSLCCVVSKTNQNSAKYYLCLDWKETLLVIKLILTKTGN